MRFAGFRCVTMLGGSWSTVNGTDYRPTASRTGEKPTERGLDVVRLVREVVPFGVHSGPC